MNNLPNTANTLLDQKRSRKIDTDLDYIEMQPSSLSSTFGFRSQVKFNQPFFPVPVKKMSIDLADQSQPKFVGCNCKNSQCLKRYCECFTRMKYCDPLICSCKFFPFGVILKTRISRGQSLAGFGKFFFFELRASNSRKNAFV